MADFYRDGLYFSIDHNMWFLAEGDRLYWGDGEVTENTIQYICRCTQHTNRKGHDKPRYRYSWIFRQFRPLFDSEGAGLGG